MKTGEKGHESASPQISHDAPFLKPKLSKMHDFFDLNAGKLECNCLIRKWKFCPKIKNGRSTQEICVDMLAWVTDVTPQPL